MDAPQPHLSFSFPPPQDPKSTPALFSILIECSMFCPPPPPLFTHTPFCLNLLSSVLARDLLGGWRVNKTPLYPVSAFSLLLSHTETGIPRGPHPPPLGCLCWESKRANTRGGSSARAEGCRPSLALQISAKTHASWCLHSP